MTEGIWCFIICFGVAQPSNKAEKGPIDTFCHSYKQVVLKKEEVGEVMKLSKGLRARLQGNELVYLCLCKKAALKECHTVSGLTEQ